MLFPRQMHDEVGAERQQRAGESRQGISGRIRAVRASRRARCGTMSPTKVTGPHKAVTGAASRTVAARIDRRRRGTLVPRLAA